MTSLEPPPSLDRTIHLVLEEADRYFEVILPHFIDRYYRGGGYEFCLRMLDAHDRGDLSVGTGTPSARALRMARGVRRECPVDVQRANKGSYDVLGRFTHTWYGTGLKIESARGVQIFAGALARLEVANETELRQQILLTIFHEYIHYFESFFLTSEQALFGREKGFFVRTLSLEQVRRRDLRHIVLRRVGWGGLMVVAVASVLAAIAASGNGPKREAPSRVFREAAKKPVSEETQQAELEKRIAEAIRDGVPPRDVERVVAKVAIYRSDVPGSRFGVLPEAIANDPDFPLVPSAMEDANVTVYWGCAKVDMPPKFIGIAWTPRGSFLLRGVHKP